jgi:hypothetical protein
MTMNISQEKSNQSLQWTSLNDPKLMQQFVEKFNDLLQVKPEKRNDALQKIINQILGATETPSIDEIAQGNFAQNGSGNQAAFDSEKWKININSSRISQLNSSNAGKLARLIYHEMRHVEQSYRIAQWLASPPNFKGFKDIQKITDGDIKEGACDFLRRKFTSLHFPLVLLALIGLPDFYFQKVTRTLLKIVLLDRRLNQLITIPR